MPALLDLTGQRFGRLLVLARSGNLGKAVGWSARCDCGRTTTARSTDLQRDDHADPDERIGATGTGRGLAYSLNASHYQPRCKPCHGAFNAPTRKATTCQSAR